MPNEEELEIGRLISLELEKRQLNPDYVGSIIYCYLGFERPNLDGSEQGNFETGRLYVQLVLDGFIYGSDGHVARVLKKRTRLDRLAILLFAIGVGPNDPLIERISRHDADFAYPPCTEMTFGILPLLVKMASERTNPPGESIDERVSLCYNEIKACLERAKAPNKTPWIYHSPLHSYSECLEILKNRFPEIKD